MSLWARPPPFCCPTSAGHRRRRTDPLSRPEQGGGWRMDTIQVGPVPQIFPHGGRIPPVFPHSWGPKWTQPDPSKGGRLTGKAQVKQGKLRNLLFQGT
jgi:hypothetical protein